MSNHEYTNFQNLLVVKKIVPADEYKDAQKDIKLVFSINGKLLTKEEFGKTFPQNKIESDKNKKRIFKEMSSSSSNASNKSDSDLSNKNIGKKKKQTSNNIVPSKNINTLYNSWTIKKLEEEISKVEKSLSEFIEEKEQKDGKEIKRVDLLYMKWLKISQDAVEKILEMFPENNNFEKNTIKTLIDHFKIDKELIDYDSENDCFN